MSDARRAPAPTTLPAPGRRDRASSRRRPTPVTILAVVQLVTSLGYLATVLTLLGAEMTYLRELARDGILAVTSGSVQVTALVGALALMTVLGVSSSILLFRMKKAGWTITMLVTGWSLAAQILLYYLDGQASLSPLIMLLNVVIVLYLNQRAVRSAFGIGRPEADEAETELEERA